MNTKILIVTFGVLLSVTTFAQVVCVEKGISTNPDAPINPEAPSPLWLNEFKWYDNDGLSLFQYALHDMFSVNGQELMSHPYSNQNSYGYLTDFEIQKLLLTMQTGTPEYFDKGVKLAVLKTKRSIYLE